jgi:hypothetical protein
MSRDGIAVALSIALLFAAREAEAHLALGVYGALTADGGALTSVRIGHGLATVDELGRWRFVCPTVWEGPDSPPALGVPGEGSVVVIGASRPFEISLDAIAESRPAAGVTALTTKKMIHAGPSVLTLASTRDTSVVYAFERGRTRPLLGDRYIDSIAGGADRIYVATATSTGMAIEEIGLDGALLAKRTVSLDSAASAVLSLERTNERLFAGVLKTGDFRLFEIEGERASLIATATVALFGPVVVGSELFVLDRGGLARIGASGVEQVDRARRYNCLEELDGRTYACADRELYVLAAGGVLQEKKFSVADVLGPRLSHLGEDAQVACEFEWTIFAGEAQLDPAIPEEPGTPDGGIDPDDSARCDCSSTKARPEASTALIVLLICMIRENLKVTRGVRSSR